MAQHTPRYHQLEVHPKNLGPLRINYVEAGNPEKPTILLLHGFPSSTSQFRNFIPLLSMEYHVLAPDLPGFGLTTYPATFPFTFDNLTLAIRSWLDTLQVTSYAVYIFDYGAPVGLRLALEKPEEVKAIVTQNGNAYDEGFGHPFWDPIEALWSSDNSSTAREVLRENVLTLATTQYQYTAGVPEADLPLIDPFQAYTDYLANIAGAKNQENQLDLFYDYRKNKALYPDFQRYFRDTQVPLLAIWGGGDPAFVPAGAEAFRRDLPGAEVDFVEGGHFLLETKSREVAEAVLRFLGQLGF